MKIRILGCGGSFGSPLAWNKNGNIDIKNKKNIRTRSSLLLNLNNHNILIDTSPDLRNQLYEAKCTNIDSVIFTHLHSDHTAGLPDMRSMSLINDKSKLYNFEPGYYLSLYDNLYGFTYYNKYTYYPFISKFYYNNEIYNIIFN